MANVLSKGTMLPTEIVSELVNLVKGHSTLAVLCNSKPIPFNGQQEFTFNLDKEVDIVAENGKKTPGGASMGSRITLPVKFEYSMRTSDEFLYGTEEYRMDVLRQFSEGFGRKLARGLDLAAFHGINPRTQEASAVVGDNHFDKAVTATVEYDAATADDCLDEAVQAVTTAEHAVTGIAMAPVFGSDMSKIKVNGVVQYPEFRFGGRPSAFYGMKTDVNETVSAYNSKDVAIAGNFADMFRWGYAKDIPLEVIKYGNPDNDEEQGDLKGRNQVLLRCEAYIGWSILDPSAFARIVTSE